MDNFHCFIKEEIELLSNEEKTARSLVIIADVSLEPKQQWRSGRPTVGLLIFQGAGWRKPI
jgi:hypothetical protein